MDYEKLAERLFPHITLEPEYYEARFPARQVPQGALVTRIGPSPTGFIHLGNLYNAIISERLAHQSGGRFFLRIEDTDNKREVEGAVHIIITALSHFGISFDEGATESGDSGDYGPYRQRQRKEIYQSFAKRLVKLGLAYPCFCTEEELEKMREAQKERKVNFGYYGEWAADRENSMEQIEEKLSAGLPFVLRFRSSGDEKNFVEVADAIRGTLSVQENYQDFVLLKSDGIPTYHFAHVVDDHLMRTTHVVRGEEWLPSLPMHVQLFDAFGWPRPMYCHTAQLMKLDGSSKRKLSKRKDPELALEYYRAEGYPPAVMWEYLLTLLNSNYEEWRIANPTAPIADFPFTLEKMSNSGALFDLVKLSDVSKEAVSRMSASEIYDGLLLWAKEYDPEFAALLARDRAYAEAAIAVGRSGDKPRKDIVTWKQARAFLAFYYDELFALEEEWPENVDEATRREILTRYLSSLDYSDDKDTWFGKIRALTEELGYAAQPKKYKKNPELYRGSISDVSNAIRVALTGRRSSPDIYEINAVIGEARVRARLERFAR